MMVRKRDGSAEPADKRKIARCVERACKGLADVDAALLTDETFVQIHDNVSTADIHRATVLAARARIVSEPNYGYVAARLVLHGLYREAFDHCVDHRSLERDYRRAFLANLRLLVEVGRFSPAMLSAFDLDALAAALRPERDLLLKYLGVQTLYDRYINHVAGRRLETPQAFWMRVAMGLSLAEPDPTAFALALYEQFSLLLSCPATPTLLNAGKSAPQLSSCFVSTLEDSIDGIYGTLHGQARLSKFGGGLGIDLTPLRGSGSYIRGTNGFGQGLVPWAKQFNDMVVAVNQGGSRKGAGVLYLEPWHIDYLDFLDLRKGAGDERRRCHDVNTASWIPDEFVRRVEEGAPWYFFCPSECPDLHELFGEAFSSRYRFYTEEAEAGRLKNWRRAPAKDIWKKMLVAIKETGHPWFVFKDPWNERYTNRHAGVIHSSNLCLEVGGHTIPTRYDEGAVVEVGETFVCNLASPNILAHADGTGNIDWGRLCRTVRNAVRALDNVIDLNHYPTPETRKSNLRYRPVGLGLMGWADLLRRKRLPFDSDEAIALADELQEFVSYHAIMASSELARERGAYPGYAGSLWSQGILPIDTHREFMRTHRGGEWEGGSALAWDSVRGFILRHGMRNGLVMAIAPNATTAGFLGCSESVGPVPSVLFVYSTLSGNFTLFDEQFVREMKGRGLWNAELVAALQKADGDLDGLGLPADVEAVYKTAFRIDQKKLIDAGARRQKWLDQGQSLNLYYDGNSMKELSGLYLHAWRRGLKSTYYLHGKAASKVGKNTVVAAPPAAEVGTVEMCPIDGSCEACSG